MQGLRLLRRSLPAEDPAAGGRLQQQWATTRSSVSTPRSAPVAPSVRSCARTQRSKCSSRPGGPQGGHPGRSASDQLRFTSSKRRSRMSEKIPIGEKVLMKGNEAIGEAAIQAGCMAYFGYPITPQNELTAYMSKRMVEEGRVFIQTESEIAAINMCFGAACVGARCDDVVLEPRHQPEAGGHLATWRAPSCPSSIVNVKRGGPGLGNIAPAQSDYFQATRGGGHGDYRVIVFAPEQRAGALRLHDARVRPGRQVQQPGDDPGRRHPRPDDGAARAAASTSRCPTCRPSSRGGWATRRRRTRCSSRRSILNVRGMEERNFDLFREVRGDREERDALRGGR